MPKFQKYVNALFLVAAALVWFLSRHYITVLIGYFQLGRNYGTLAEVLNHTLPILLGVLTFLLLRRNRSSHEFVTDSIVELTKVSWPSSREVRFGTIIVIVTVIVSGLLLGALDVGLTAVIKTLIGA